MARGHRSLSARGSGFTIVELAVSIAIIAVLSVTTMIGSQAYLRMGREQRTSSEMRRLLVSGRNFAAGSLHSTVGFTNGTYDLTTSSPIRTFAGLAISDPNSVTEAAIEHCFDLACTTGTCWGAARKRNDLVNGGALDAILGSTTLGFTGQNLFQQPFALCVRARRVEVRTCLPSDEVPADLSTETCAFTCSVAGHVCKSIGASLLPPNLSRLAFAYRFQYWGEATDVH